MIDLVVALPAHNERALIGACLQSVSAAVAQARRAGVVRHATIAVALHRCSDDTGAQAEAALADAGVDSMLLTVPERLPVGAVRTRLVEAATAGLDDRTWVFSTDADTVVPVDWITATLHHLTEQNGTRQPGADLVLGLVDLQDWRADAAAHQAYAQIVSAGLTEAGHAHVYAANLAIRLGAFRCVGGFPGLEHGEEHGLTAACRAAGLTVASLRHPRVRTSARMPGRADHGLGTLLSELARAAESA